MRIPQRIISDNGSKYTGDAYKEFVKECGIDHVTSAPKYPMSNGMVERAIITIKLHLTKSGIDQHVTMLSTWSTPISDHIPSPAFTADEQETTN